jgi:hypothetical protein
VLLVINRLRSITRACQLDIHVALDHRIRDSGALVPGDGSTDVTTVLDRSLSGSPTARPRLGAVSAAALAVLTAAGLLLDQSGTANAATAIGLGTAKSYAVLAGSGITNTNPTTITGDIGTGPTVTTITGRSEITLTGIEVTDQVKVGAAKADLQTAYDNAAGQATTRTISADLAGETLNPGVYTSASSMGLSGALTLNGGGNADAIFVFQTVSALTINPSSSVTLINGAQACNVFWKVGSSATLDTGTVFVGNILAHDSVSLNTGARVTGRVLAMGGAVTMNNNVITRPGCTGPAGGSGGSGSGGDGSGTDGTSQVAQVPVGSVDAGDGSSLLGRTSDYRE